MAKIELNQYEINTILNTLAEKPYKEVHFIIADILAQIDTPANCTECTHAAGCRAPYYGGSLCKHADEINRAAIAAILDKKGASTK